MDQKKILSGFVPLKERKSLAAIDQHWAEGHNQAATMDQNQSVPDRSQATPPPPSPLQPLHQSDADEEDENVKQLDDCASVYLSMQECIVNSNRDWKACQAEVHALRACMEKRK